MPTPIYTDHDEKYRADSCKPLLDAAAAGTIALSLISHGHYPGKSLPAETLPGLKMVGFWDARHRQDWGLPWHRNEGIELTFLESGTLEFAIAEEQFTLKSNDLIIARPWQRHRIGNPLIGPSRLHWLLIDVGVRRPHQEWKWPPWLILSASDIVEITTILRQNEQPVWRTNSEIRRCFQILAHLAQADCAGSKLSRIGHAINELFLLFLENLREQDVRLDDSLVTSRRTVQLFLDDLRTHPEHLGLEWSLESMATSCRLGITQFTKHVKSLVNATPLNYLIQCRIDYAAAQLRENPASSITDIALNCGFCSGQYFATVFAQHMACSPREYRARVASK